MIPQIRVSGGPFQRGLQYGSLCRAAVGRSMDLYARVFEAVAGLRWHEVVVRANQYRSLIADLSCSYIDEMRGMAEGARVGLGDVIALNARTEVMFGAIAGNLKAHSDGCSAFALGRTRTRGGHILVGQNWDWIPEVRENLVLVDAQRADGPGYVTLVEAGLLAKTGMNSAGVAVTTNALISRHDTGGPGVPYHVLLRGVLDCPSAEVAAQLVMQADRASSGNYLIGDSSGCLVDVEAAAGGPALATRMASDSDKLCRTNHFTSHGAAGDDLMPSYAPDTLNRLVRIDTALGSRGRMSVRDLQVTLSDHVGWPGSVCHHPDEAQPWHQQVETLASVIYQVDIPRVWVAAGSPCKSRFREVGRGCLSLSS